MGSNRWRYHCAVRRRLRPGGPPKTDFQLFGGCVAAAALAVAEQVALALGAARPGGQRRLEPRVLVGGVVGDQVDDHLEAELVGPRDQRVGVGERAEQRVDVAVVGHVVPVVVLRAGCRTA